MGESGEGKPPTVPASTPRTVLLVDDEDMVRRCVRHLLEREGYRVVEASSGTGALEAAEGVARIDLLLSDIVMEGMTGIELSHRLRASRPGLPVLLMSGYPVGSIDLPGGAPATHFIQKPFRLAEFRTEVQGALDAR
jgi:two-component system cell cycle sensor histidine kinase/response regulator CckA